MNNNMKHRWVVRIVAFSALALAAYSLVLSPHEQRGIAAIETAPVATSSDPSAFISTWNTALTSTGSSGINQVRLPLISNGTYDFVVAWGDGTNDTITAWNQAQVMHMYASAGVYTINITGTI